MNLGHSVRLPKEEVIKAARRVKTRANLVPTNGPSEPHIIVTELAELAHRAVSCKGWRWMPGMLAIVPPVHDGSTGYLFRISDMCEPMPHRAYPDLADPATLGCLLALVREAWDADFIDVVCEQANDAEDGGYVWRVNLPYEDTRAATEAEALVAALEKAP